MSVRAGDQLSTGASARLVLQLAEGSLVKLGENAQFGIEKLHADSEAGNSFFKGVLEVLKGAFRFSTTALSKRYTRNIDIRVATVTAGIRGTDLWGKAAESRDFVVLIEGSIDVQRAHEPAVRLSDPLSAYFAPKDAPSQLVSAVDPNQLALWAEETEPQVGSGVMTTRGAWSVNLGSYRERRFAEDASRGLQEKGYGAEIRQVEVDGEGWFRISVRGFVSRSDADAVAKRLGGAWVSN